MFRKLFGNSTSALKPKCPECHNRKFNRKAKGHTNVWICGSCHHKWIPVAITNVDKIKHAKKEKDVQEDERDEDTDYFF